MLNTTGRNGRRRSFPINKEFYRLDRNVSPSELISKHRRKQIKTHEQPENNIS